MRARACRYRSSLTFGDSVDGAGGSAVPRRIGIGPEDDDQDAVAVRWPTEERGGPRRRDDVRAHLGLIALEQPHAHAHALALHLVGCHLEPSLARDREA